jgi:hypothetical protein
MFSSRISGRAFSKERCSDKDIEALTVAIAPASADRSVARHRGEALRHLRLKPARMKKPAGWRVFVIRLACATYQAISPARR